MYSTILCTRQRSPRSAGANCDTTPPLSPLVPLFRPRISSDHTKKYPPFNSNGTIQIKVIHLYDVGVVGGQTISLEIALHFNYGSPNVGYLTRRVCTLHFAIRANDNWSMNWVCMWMVASRRPEGVITTRQALPPTRRLECTGQAHFCDAAGGPTLPDATGIRPVADE